jgi:hypothetical protein
MSISYKQKIAIGILCFIIATVVYKIEVLDHRWFLIERNAAGYIEGWNSVEDAITKNVQWNCKECDFKKADNDSFMYRQHVNTIIGYVIPLTLLGIGIIFIISKRD